MIHHGRVFGVTEMPDLQILADKLFYNIWPLCTGFQLRQFLFLNDSYFDDSIKEFAVFKATYLGYIKIESLTIWYGNFSGSYLEDILTNCIESKSNFGSYDLKLENIYAHKCHLCKRY